MSISKKRSLGRGLDALLNGSQAKSLNAKGDKVIGSHLAKGRQLSLPVEKLKRGKFQPRKEFDKEKLNELANSISAQGIVQPIVVREINNDLYEIIAGERRWRAAQLAGLAEVPVVVKQVDDRSAMAMALIENIQRDNLNALEEASALHKLVDRFGLTHQQVAKAVGKSRAMISNLLRLLELSSEVKKFIEKGLLEMGHARAILPLSTSLQKTAANEVVKKRLSVRETEALVRQLSNKKPSKSTKKNLYLDPNIQRLNKKLSNQLGAKVVVKGSKGGKGKIEISYNSLDELEGILDHIK
tara:strand:- start:302 stop:1198 length:897 start_codon:yes stop_codon:yes gene_type:complete